MSEIPIPPGNPGQTPPNVVTLETARTSPFHKWVAGALGWLTDQPLAIIALIIVTVVVVGALAAPILVGDPLDITADFLAHPSSQHLMGTDEVGRDLLARVVYGARLSLLISSVVLIFSILIGVALGALAALGGGWIDEVIMRITDTFFAFPYLILAMLIAAILRPNLESTLIALVIVWWPTNARLVRAQILRLREETYVKAARASGATDFYIFRRHLASHLVGMMMVKLTSDFGRVILIASGLSFIGLGVQPPQPEWGSMLADARVYSNQAWWYSLFPGLALCITVLGFTLLGDELQTILEPRLRRR